MFGRGRIAVGLDLAFAITAMSSLGLAAFLFGISVSSKSNSRSSLLFIFFLLLTLEVAWYQAGSLAWADWFADSAVVYWSNLMPVLLGMTAGLAMNAPGLGRWHRPFSAAVLGMLGIGYILSPVARPVVAPAVLDIDTTWADDVCLQSHPASCGAAAAATLLRLNGVKSTEQEMADVCLTSAHGTMPLGLYRGLSLVASRHGRSANVAANDPGQWLRMRQLPVAAMIQFPPDFATDLESGPLKRLLGPRGEGHAIVIIGKTDAGRWIIGDPAVGRICWTDKELRDRFTGEAIYLSRDVN